MAFALVQHFLSIAQATPFLPFGLRWGHYRRQYLAGHWPPILKCKEHSHNDVVLILLAWESGGIATIQGFCKSSQASAI
jgi:hypothetical protein